MDSFGKEFVKDVVLPPELEFVVVVVVPPVPVSDVVVEVGVEVDALDTAAMEVTAPGDFSIFVMIAVNLILIPYSNEIVI